VFGGTAANTYTGPTTINGGILQVGVAQAVPVTSAVTVASGGTLDVNDFTDSIGSLAGAGSVILGHGMGGTLTVGLDNTTTTFSGVVSGLGTFAKDGMGMLTLSGASTYSGPTIIRDSSGFHRGVLQIGLANALPVASAVMMGGALLDLNNFNLEVGSLEGATYVGIALGNGTGGTLTVGANNTSTVFFGFLTGQGGLTKIGTGTLALDTAPQRYSGPTIVTAGTLQTLVGGLPSGNVVTVASGATLDLSGSEPFASLAGAGTVILRSGTLTVGGDNTSTTFSGTISASGLTKAGSGVLTLTGNSTFSLPTTISAGSLEVDGALPNTSVTINAGATLRGSGTVGSIATAGIVSPGMFPNPMTGTDVPGILRTGNTTFSGGSSLVVSLNGTTAGTGYSQLNVTGTVDLSGTPTLSVALLPGFMPALGNTFTIIASTGGAITGTFTGLPEGAVVTFNRYTFRVSYASHNVTLTVTQTPSATTTSLSSLPTASFLGQPVTFAAIVSSVPPATGTPTGTVTFNDGTAVLGTGMLNSTGLATFTTSSLTVGTHTITATYNGGGSFGSSTSPVLGQTVTQTATGTPNQRLVTQIYLDLLGRPVDAFGLSGWSASLDQGASRSQVVLAIESSLEYRTIVVQRLYQRFLHRAAEPSGLTGFTQFLAGGGTIEQAQSIITGSAEYFQTRAGGTNDGFLNALYGDVLNRAVDPGGRDGWTAALTAGASRAAVAAAIFGSLEYRQDLVQSLYPLFLRRAVDPSGLSFFSSALQTGTRDEQVNAIILGSDEYSAGCSPGK
jgi:autotransporter-associated beta strand protein